jgi:tRNA-dihydrouridine synthase
MATGEHLSPPTITERIEVIRKHLYGSVSWKGPIAGINEMKRHYANYLHGLHGIKEYRNKLVVLKTVTEIDEVLEEVRYRYENQLVEN